MASLDDPVNAEPGEIAAEIAYPPHLAIEVPPYRPGTKRIAVDRYFRKEYHDLEVERIWKKCWQMACRVEDIPDIGDFHVYEIATLSFIVVRTGTEEIRAFWNACLHRGRKLCDHDGRKAEEFRCMFHGWAWNIDGSMSDMVCDWDFPGTEQEKLNLPECRVGTWGGWVFINPDPECGSLEDYLGTLPDHFEGAGHDMAKRWKQVHVVAELPVNWKIIQEAFAEAWHVCYTHPQMVRSPNHRDTIGVRWDDFGNWMRGAPALPTDRHKSPGSWSMPAECEQQVVDMHYDQDLNKPDRVTVPEGGLATEVITATFRKKLRETIGDAVDDYHPVHLGVGEMVAVFPNFHPWGGFSRLVYRFRPLGNDPERSLMDVQLMAPWPQDKPKPPPAPPHYLGPNGSITDAPELGHLTRVFMQDLGNLPHIQAGLHTIRSGHVVFSSLNEAPIRKFHDLYEEWMGLQDGDTLARGGEK